MVDVVAFGAHPDDIEFGCGGILARLAKEGLKLILVDLTGGEKGTNGTPEKRRKEALAAAAVIGAERVFLDFNDCEVIDTYEGRLRLVRVLRHYRPRLVLAPLWTGTQNHPDHLACGLMARYACRYSRFAKILPELSSHQVDGILHYGPRHGGDVDFMIDVSDYIDIWKKMMLCHESQFQTHPYDEWVLTHAREMGMWMGKAFAQGLTKGNPILVEDVMSVSRGIREL